MSKNTEGAFAIPPIRWNRWFAWLYRDHRHYLFCEWFNLCLPSDQQQLYEYGTSCDPTKACHVIYVSSTTLRTLCRWFDVMSLVAAAFNSTAAPKDLQYQIPPARGNVGTLHALLRDSLLLLVFWWHQIGIQLYGSYVCMVLLPYKLAIITYNLGTGTTRRTILSKVNWSPGTMECRSSWLLRLELQIWLWSSSIIVVDLEVTVTLSIFYPFRDYTTSSSTCRRRWDMRGTPKEESCPGAKRSSKHGCQEARKKWQSMDIVKISLLHLNMAWTPINS